MCNEIKKSLIKEKYNLMVIFLVILQFLIIYLSFRINNPEILFWFCNHTPFILAIAFYFRKKDLIKSIINVGFLFQFFWTIDFFSKLFFGVYIFEATSYVFEREFGILMLIPILVHLFVINLSFIFTYDYKPRINSLFYSLIYAILLYGFSLRFTLVDSNINCVYKICNFPYSPPGYIYFWPIFVFFLIIIPTQILQLLVWRLNEIMKKSTNVTSEKKLNDKDK